MNANGVRQDMTPDADSPDDLPHRPGSCDVCDDYRRERGRVRR